MRPPRSVSAKDVLRRGRRQGYPEAAVTWRKLWHTVRAAEAYCVAHTYTGNWRVDVIALVGGEVRHLRNVTV